MPSDAAFYIDAADQVFTVQADFQCIETLRSRAVPE